jgi:hypothetical protein
MKESVDMSVVEFGKPEMARVRFVDPALLEQATIVYRAIHTLELLSEYGIIEDDESIPSFFVAQSWQDLKRLLEIYKAQGIRMCDIDIGEYTILS